MAESSPPPEKSWLTLRNEYGWAAAFVAAVVALSLALAWWIGRRAS